MTYERRQIFRSEALKRYTERQDKAVFPRLVCPRWIAALWLVLLLLGVVAGILLVSIRMPLYCPGAVLTAQKGVGDSIVLVSASNARSLSPGQQVLLDSPIGCTVARLVAIESETASAEYTSERFGITGKMAPGIEFPVVIGFVEQMGDCPLPVADGSRTQVVDAKICIGSCRAISSFLRARELPKFKNRS